VATQADIEARMARLKSRLEYWGENLSPEGIRSFGAKAWEYSASSYGGLPEGPDGQGLVPDEIRMARYNYYFVEHDLSFGVHNAKYARYLLDVANRKLDDLDVPW